MNFRTEHPRPEAFREDWISLNGVWDFEIDNDKAGIDGGYEKRTSFSKKINVPFCPESKLSGIANTDFMSAVWYAREINIPTEWRKKRVLLHIEACDYATRVYINGILVGSHKGGYTPFKFDITPFLSDSKNYVTIYAEDDTRSKRQASGKQSERQGSYGCFYTRTTGIWQSVWLEAVNAARIEKYHTLPNITDASVCVNTDVTEAALGATLSLKAVYDGKTVGAVTTRVTSRRVCTSIKLDELHLWELGDGRLYDLVFELSDGEVLDTVKGYFGMREVFLRRDGFYLNGKRVFGRFVLDQGFYPDGIYTAPSDEALIYDIKASMALGFNGARLHQKVFEPRFLYHADRLGYMVFGETASWGLDWTEPTCIYDFLPEWIEEVERDMSHPSIIGWCPFNETWDLDGRRHCNDFINMFYYVTRAIDPSRLIVTNSGSYPTTDVKNTTSDTHDVHDYEQDPEKLREYYAHIDEGLVNCQLMRMDPNRQHYDPDKPIFVSEYGGIKWVEGEMEQNGKNDESSWGYGNNVRSEDEFFARLKGLTDVLLDNERIFAFCYTQLTDVEQEQNGLLTYGRKFKFPPERIRAIISRQAAIEK